MNRLMEMAGVLGTVEIRSGLGDATFEVIPKPVRKPRIRLFEFTNALKNKPRQTPTEISPIIEVLRTMPLDGVSAVGNRLRVNLRHPSFESYFERRRKRLWYRGRYNPCTFDEYLSHVFTSGFGESGCYFPVHCGCKYSADHTKKWIVRNDIYARLLKEKLPDHRTAFFPNCCDESNDWLTIGVRVKNGRR